MPTRTRKAVVAQKAKKKAHFPIRDMAAYLQKVYGDQKPVNAPEEFIIQQ